MKNKVKKWLRKLVLWAIDDYFEEQTRHRVAQIQTSATQSVTRITKENGNQWRMLNARIAALSATYRL